MATPFSLEGTLNGGLQSPTANQLGENPGTKFQNQPPNPQKPPPNFKFLRKISLIVLLLVSIISVLIFGFKLLKHKPSPAPSTVTQAQKDTSELVSLAKKYEKSQGKEKEALESKIKETAAARKKEVLSLIKEDKISEALALSIPDAERKPIQDLAPNDLEQSFNKEGTLLQTYIEKANEKPQRVNMLQQSPKEVYLLKFVDEPNQNGARISVDGYKWDNTVLVKDSKTSNVQGTSISTGPQKVAVILVRWQDQPPEYPNGSKTDVEGYVNFMKNFFLASSNGQLDIQPDVYGWFNIPLNVGTSCNNDPVALWTQIPDFINASTASVDFTQYGHVHFVVNCNTSLGFAWMPPVTYPIVDSTGTKSVTIGFTSSTNGAYVTPFGNQNFGNHGLTHEIGHQLGADHSNDWDCGSAIYTTTGCTTQEYNGLYSVMGVDVFDVDAPHKDIYGWLNSGNTQTITSSSPFRLCPFESTSCINVIKVPRITEPMGGTVSWYYVEWRQPTGLDTGIPSAGQNGALIRFNQPGDIHSYLIDSTPDSTSADPNDWTDLIDAAFKPGTSFSDPTNGVTISITSIDASGLSGTVTIGAPPPPSPTPSTWSISASVSGNTVTFSHTPPNGNFGVWAAPNCDFTVPPAFDSGPLPIGSPNTTIWNSAPPGTYCGGLVYGFSVLAKTPNFTIGGPPPPGECNQINTGQYKLKDPPSISGTNANFTFENGSLSLPILSSQEVYLNIIDANTGLPATGGNIHVSGNSQIWNGYNGTFCAALTYFTAQISNAVRITLSSTPPTPTPNPTPTPPPPPKPEACSNAVQTDNLTDHYITDDKGNPQDPNFTFTIKGTGAPGSTVTAVTDPPNKQFTFTLDMSKLQAIFADNNSNYTEGRYQDPNHQQAPLTSVTTEDRDNFFGPNQKAGSKVLTNQLRVKYVNYVYNKPTLAESTSIITDVNGLNPHTIYDMVQKWGAPNPDSANFQSTWGPYWVKIPTAYNEYYEGKLEFKVGVGSDMITQIKNGGTCPVPFDSRPPITFIMPDTFRAAATTGITNMMLAPKIAQSTQNNLILQASTQGTQNVLAKIIKRCVFLASQNPLTKALKKVVSYLQIENIHPIKNAYAASDPTCVKVLGNGRSGTAPYCAVPAGQLPAGTCSQPNANDPNQLDPQNTNVVCNITFTFSKQMDLPTSGNGQWDSCAITAGIETCTATVSVWPVFRIPWIGEIWNHTLASDTAENIDGPNSIQKTGRPGVYAFFTPNLVLQSANQGQQDPLAAHLQDLLDQCKAGDCSGLLNWANLPESDNFPQIKKCVEDNLLNLPALKTCASLMAESIISGLTKKLPGQVGGASLGVSTSNVLGDTTGEGKQPLIGSTDCFKMFVRDMALKPLVLQHYQNIDTSCIPKPTMTPNPTTSPTPPPTPGPTPTPTPLPTLPPEATPTPTPKPTPTPTPKATPTPTPTPPNTSLNLSWGRPWGYAGFVDVNKKTSDCRSTSLSCSTPKFIFWPGSSLIFEVRVTDGTGPIIKSGGTRANADGSASMSWGWSYVAVVYPASFSSCSAAGSLCKTQTINDNSTLPQATFTGLQPSTTYQETVCAPNCGTGLVIFSSNKST